MFANRARDAAAGLAVEKNLVISSNTNNYNIYNELIASGWNGVDPVTATITINNGVIVGSSSTGTFSFDTGAAANYPVGSSLTLINNGRIYGRGGAGGGGAGGSALRAQRAITINNTNGIIASGGNGGGNGSSATGTNYTFDGEAGCFVLGTCTAPGGIGGAGAGSQNNGVAQAGSSGSCCGNHTVPCPDGVRCGSSGSTGGALGTGSGVAVSGNSNITWTAFGSRLGTIS